MESQTFEINVLPSHGLTFLIEALYVRPTGYITLLNEKTKYESSVDKGFSS